ncbi:acyl-CoA dehydrogenase [uncultured Xylophilus sp.]|uniref:acyl-CoA dehydrogenase n=1 Tax=uncultured Xylophilus sp. TaxID=296832 RepID=UPI0025CED40C|nr:acyl-CoA dehydrogenase [uncultured Xylophilus sp.]
MHDDLYADALRALLADHCTPQTVRAIEHGGSPTALWTAIEASGFADALVPDDQGGAGLTWPEAFPLFELCGSVVLPVPLAETMAARALLAQAGVAPPAGSIALAQGVRTDDGGVTCCRVSAGGVADWVLAGVGDTGQLLPTAAATSAPAVAPLDATLAWAPAAVAAAHTLACGADALRTVQAGVVAAQLAGALGAVFTRTLQFANERQQFGRAIGKFQAIQHQLAVIAEHVFAARMAAQLGCGGDRLRVAVAKARTAEAALEVASLSHAIHGAIGFTEEFDLQLYTRRLHAWRQAAGAESYWQEVLGTALLDGTDGPALDLLRTLTDPA